VQLVCWFLASGLVVSTYGVAVGSNYNLSRAGYVEKAIITVSVIV
jgi:hypothetical protein